MESPNKRIKLEHPVQSPAAPIPPPGEPAKADPEPESSSAASTEPVDLLPEDQQYRRRYLLRGHSKAVSSVKFSPDGKYLASACTPKSNLANK
jgi:WD40 repeat protein